MQIDPGTDNIAIVLCIEESAAQQRTHAPYIATQHHIVCK